MSIDSKARRCANSGTIASLSNAAIDAQGQRKFAIYGLSKYNAKSLFPFLLVAAFSLAGFPGCGYKLVGTDISVLPPRIKTLAIPPLINDTNEPNLEQPFTATVRERFMNIDRIEIVDSKEKADAVLTITIISYNENVPISFQDNRSASEYRLELNLEAVFLDREGKELWSKKNLFVFAEYKVSSDPSVTRSNENKAKEAAALEFARDFFSYLY